MLMTSYHIRTENYQGIVFGALIGLIRHLISDDPQENERLKVNFTVTGV